MMAMIVIVAVIMAVPMFVTVFSRGISVAISANPFDMMMMACLRQSLVCLKPHDLLTVFAQQTVHVVVAGKNSANPFLKRVDDRWMIAKVTGLDEFDVRVPLSNLVNDAITPVNRKYGNTMIRL